MKKFPRKVRERKEKPERFEPVEDRRRPRFSLNASVLYEDDAVAVLDKPAGLLAVPIKGSEAPSALSVLASRLRSKKQQAMIVHRIDRFASGALLFAKTHADRNVLVKQFLAHTPVRHYLAVVRGHLGSEKGTLAHHFKRQGMYQQLRTPRDPKASRAELRYSVERVFADATLVRVELVTGFQNQIRAQFSAMGHPVIGDRKYHREEASEQMIARVALHAAHLEFVHPRTGKTVAVDCKLPPDFQHLIRELGRTRAKTSGPVRHPEPEREPKKQQQIPRRSGRRFGRRRDRSE